MNNIAPIYQISNTKYQFEKKGNKYFSHENDNSYILTVYPPPGPVFSKVS